LGTLRPSGLTPVERSEYGLIFQSELFHGACRDYCLRQEFITSYTPQQNGIVERFFRSLKEECVQQHSFGDFAEARAADYSMDQMVRRGTTTPGSGLMASHISFACYSLNSLA
jgi:transposase InsO family protein